MLLLRAMHVRIPLTRNNLLPPSLLFVSSFSFQFPATPVPAAFVICVHVLPEFIAGSPRASMRPYSGSRIAGEKDGEKTFRDFSQSRLRQCSQISGDSLPVYLTTRIDANSRTNYFTSTNDRHERAPSLLHMYRYIRMRFISLVRKIQVFPIRDIIWRSL